MRRALVACLFVVGCSGSETASSPNEVDGGDVDVDDGSSVDATTDTLADPDTSTASDGAMADTATADTTTADTAMADTAPAPSCPSAAPCPATPSGVVESSGPRAIERCAFVLTKDAASPEAAITALGGSLKKVTIAEVLSDLNRTAKPITASALPGVPGFSRGFAWDDDDNGKAWWIPQGLTGTPDANATGTVAGRKAVLATWYYDIAKHPGSTGEKGIRISVADVTGTTVTYRHLLLVTVSMSGGRADFAPINIHAGGVAWVGDRLYVADTGSGLRVFDLSRIFEVSTAKDEIGWDGAAYQGGLYKYIVPQIELVRDTSKCNPVFSFVALDRSATPPALVTGEYVADAITGRVFQWPIDLATGAMTGTTWASGAWVMAQRQVQGAVTRNGVFYFSSSAPAAGGGVLYVARPGKKTLSYPWVDAPEDLMIDEKAELVWGASEGTNKRYVFAVKTASLVAP